MQYDEQFLLKGAEKLLREADQLVWSLALRFGFIVFLLAARDA